MPKLTLTQLRQHAMARTLRTATTLPRAIERLGFVQMDPIRAPARAQCLMLRLRVRGYRAGDLERRYPKLALEEDFFINYGVMPRELQALLHPRTPETLWPKARWKQAHEVLEFVRERGVVHPREVDEHFQHGKTTNWFGGQSNASTQLLDGMHYRGLLRTARREGGIRLYGVREAHEAPLPAPEAMDRLVRIVVEQYAPLPELTLNMLVTRIHYGAPQWRGEVRAALARAKARLPHAEVDGLRWFWPEGENPAAARWRTAATADTVRLLAPFDPVVWDRRRFELLWGWAYRFEAYTPAAKRVRGYYALPLAWREHVIGWANLSVRDEKLHADVGFVEKRPCEASFAPALETELQSFAEFLGVETAA